MTQDSKPKTKLWLRVVLAGSLGVNLLLIGLAVGAALRFHGGAHPPPGLPVGSALFMELDKETRKALRKRAEGDHGSYRERRRAEGEAVLTLLRAAPFDAAALTELLQRQANERHEFQRSVQEAWLSRVSAMTDDDRQDYAQRLQKALQRGKPPKQPRGDDH